MTFSPRHSRPATPSKSRSYLYSPNHSRSRSSLPQPKVLPFPDIPVRPISHESSRSASPFTSPVPTRRSSSQDVSGIHRVTEGPPTTPAVDAGETLLHVSMAISRSTDSLSPTLTSPPNHASNIPTQSRLNSMELGPSRLRSSTTPASAGRPSIPPVLNLNPTNRTHGFNPIPISAPPVAIAAMPSESSTMASSGPRASSLPTTSTATTIETKAHPPAPKKKLSNPPPTPPLLPTTATQIVPTPSHQVLSDHMYQSFLKGTCADVRLTVRKWGVSWFVHKMILVQAGFFHSLFLGGFSEMSGRSPMRAGKAKFLEDEDWHGEDVELTFDDPNITRAAFEISLSRLYSPYPHLQFPSILLPTPENRLTPSFPPTGFIPDYRSIQATLPPQAVLATPRLMLSIVATTIYLGHSTLMRETLGMVLRTVGPGTVGRYLAFATGEGIGEEEWEGQTEEGARGLEGVAKPMRRRDPDDSSLRSQDHSLSISDSSSQSLSEDGVKVRGVPVPSTSDPSTPTGQNVLDETTPLSRQNSGTGSLSSLPHFYGFASNKLGEACVCWLGRWGVDVLDIELSLQRPSDIRIWSHRGLPAKFVSAVLSADTLFVRDEMERYTVARKIIDLRRNGWEAEMEGKGDLSINESLAECESDGWDMWEEDEEELAKVFAEGIYYTHMSFEDLATIAADIDPTTSLPFVPLSVLQAAHWAAADLRNKILAPANREEHELGLAITAAQLAAPDIKRRRVAPRSRQVSASTSRVSLVSSHEGSTKRSDLYHPVPVDDTYRIGVGGFSFLTASANSAAPLPDLPGLPDMGPEIDNYSVEGARPSKFRPPPQGEKTLFGLDRGCRSLSEILEEHALSISGLSLRDTSTQRWTKAEPYRFSAEFWGLDKLGEKERAYSAAHFYAGSWFNVYVQAARKKDKSTQLGIYLHRQNPAEAFPTPSAPRVQASSDITKRAKEEADLPYATTPISRQGGGALGLIGGTGMYRAISTPVVTVGSPPARNDGLRSPVSPSAWSSTGGAGDELSSPNEGVKAPYQDPRKVTKVYFTVSCATALGTALTRFSSAPDNFTVSQSWGWKTGALRTDEYIADLTPASGIDVQDLEGSMGSGPGVNREGSLRVTVVVGIL